MKHASDLKLYVDISPFVNLSLLLNDIPLIQSLIVENTSDNDVETAELCVSSDLPSFESFSHAISRLPAGKEAQVLLVGLAVSRVQHNLWIEEGELLPYVANVFGSARVERKIDGLVRYAVNLVERTGKVKQEKGRVTTNG